MKKLKFTKMHGLGNNYVYVNMFKETIPEADLPSLAVAVSNPYTGIGSDGMILICPSEKAPVKMRVFNNDGSEAKNCGNGLRCVAKYAYENGIVKEEEFQIETLGGLVRAKLVMDADHQVTQVTINMGNPILDPEQVPVKGFSNKDSVINEPVSFKGRDLNMTAVSMGNPHAVFFVDNIEETPLHSLGPVIEKDSMFPDWVNAEFVEMISDQEMHFRVWERGSGITQACGTGACAAAVAAILNKKAEKNTDITVHLAGGDLIINWQDNGDVLMTGPAEVICTGEYHMK
ncbi:diaminopimelate epimerase [Fictibacillus phosphorivorans]|uniref:diaminopimelate epimerase n=1 Tax=Fictibacillus phosphorivorans TaxID=1221500 RepID=UPI00203E1AF5|nr:diaminopimelate epimerase [Fictibacillus phosphorivorans]MCM3718765.1 diaminopimelate epimerase [Fictibacillus phosphorivorans]MCM3776388.1 diaminopimelate epimerase [Fictibacillus phosphorivorans]